MKNSNIKKRGIATLLVASALLATSVASPIGAQPEGNEQTAEEKRGAVCMVGTTAKGGLLSIILPSTDAAAMRAKGFKQESCGKAFRGRSKIEQWRDYICRIASSKNEQVQQRYEANWGERPAVLCGMAELTSSMWKRGKRS